jgi:DHA2 family multidrug resistance protein
MLRVFQAAGLAFLFIPINTLSYNGIPMTKNNDVSGLTNLARNIGGSTGTAFVVTMLARRMQFHQQRLGSNVGGAGSAFAGQVDALGHYLVHGGRAATLEGGRMLAEGNIYGQLVRQSTMLAYLDVVKVLACLMICLIPLVFLMKRPAKGKGPVGH